MAGLFDKLFGGKNEDANKQKEVVSVSVTSPIDGQLLALSELEDPAFSSGALGQGVGIIPSGDIFMSPVAAKVVTVFPTGHAIGLKTENGAEILIHIGMDTVSLNGEGFEALVKEGDQVTLGQALVRIQPQLITDKGFSLATPVVVTNSAEFTFVDFAEAGPIQAGEALFTISKN